MIKYNLLNIILNIIYLRKFILLCLGCFSIGSLIHVYPAYPSDGERAKVDIFKLENLLSHDPIARDLRAYPGPLIKQV